MACEHLGTHFGNRDASLMVLNILFGDALFDEALFYVALFDEAHLAIGVAAFKEPP